MTAAELRAILDADPRSRDWFTMPERPEGAPLLADTVWLTLLGRGVVDRRALGRHNPRRHGTTQFEYRYTGATLPTRAELAARSRG